MWYKGILTNAARGPKKQDFWFSRDTEFQSYIRQTEANYPSWWSTRSITTWCQDLAEDVCWNCYICFIVFLAMFWVFFDLTQFMFCDIVYNVTYAMHMAAIVFKRYVDYDGTNNVTVCFVIRFIIDVLSFSHYFFEDKGLTLFCYYIRLHRPLDYLWSSNNFHLKGSIIGTTLKYIYIFIIMRITWAWIWIQVKLIETTYNTVPIGRKLDEAMDGMVHLFDHRQNFLQAYKAINQMFIPIGASVYPINDVERVTCILVMISGCLMISGAAVASLSLVISLYMRPEETFRTRFMLIMKDMKQSRVPQNLRLKVETFYMMYWHRQRAVFKTRLLPTFPPTLPASIDTDVYFEATQKSRILRDLTFDILSEISQKMATIHYIPGDHIIKRGTKKSSIIYITHGDIEVLTAEDDSTAILRMTRGTILTPCGGVIAVACGRSHIAVRAATFCTAHVLNAADLWRVVWKHSTTQDVGKSILAAFNDHIEKVKRHYDLKVPDDSIYKSSIFHFNRNLRALNEMRDYYGNPLLADRHMFLGIARCYIMRNRPDASQRDETDEICLRSTFPCILQPSSSLLMTWHSFIALLILIICFVYPYYLVFVQPVPLEFRFFNYVMTLMFCLDLVTHLSTGTSIEEGGAITFTQTSSQQMKSGWFVLDVMATLPILEFCGDGHFGGINKLLRLHKVFRVLKNLEEEWVYHSNVLRFFSYSLLLIIACYLTAAVQQTFMCYDLNYCLLANLTHPPRWKNKSLSDDCVDSRIIYGLYSAISMIMFTSHKEQGIWYSVSSFSSVTYEFLMLELCVVLRLFMEAVYSATIMVTTDLREDYNALIAIVKGFLIRNQVDPELRRRFITYLELCWLTDKAYKITQGTKSMSYSTHHIFYDLPSHVYQDIVGRNRVKYLLCIPFMKCLRMEELKKLSSTTKLFYTSPNEILMNTGDLSSEIYVVVQGICEIIHPETHKRVNYLTAKSHFGAVACLLRLPSFYTIRAITHVQIFCVSRKYLMQAIDPAVLKIIEYLKTTPEYLNINKRREGFLPCSTPPTAAPNRMHFRLLRKHEPDIEFLYPFTTLGFLAILRYVFPRFTIRPDGPYLVRYEWFRVSCAMTSAMIFPSYTYLVLQWPWLYYLTILLDLAAWFDIFQRMLVGYFNELGILVYHPASTAAHYLNGAFMLDLMGCLPLEKLELPLSAPIDKFDVTGQRVTPMLQYLMMNRLFQLYRLPGAMLGLKNKVTRRDILMVVQALQLLLPLLNVLVSLIIFHSVNIYQIVVNDEQLGDWLIVPFEDEGGSWLKLFGNTFNFNITATPWNLHVATYFWVTYELTTVGYNCFQPSNLGLIKIMFIGMLCAAMLITYFSVRIISIRANVNKPLASFQQDIKDMGRFMKKEKLKEPLRNEIEQYYEYNWEKMGGINYRGVLKLCDQITLRTDAILHIYGPTFTKCPLLSKADVSLLRVLGRAVRSVYFLRGMKILEADDVVFDMYFVDYGGVEARTSQDYHTGVRLPRGSVFGNLEGRAAIRFPLEIVATSRLHLLMINSEAFYQVTKDAPDVRDRMIRFKNQDHQNYILGKIAKTTMIYRDSRSSPRHQQTGIMRSIFYQEAVVQYYLISVSLACIYLDVYNAGFQDNSRWLIYTLYTLDLCFFVKIVMQIILPLIVINKNIKRILLPIRSMYFKREFKYDAISCVPIELLALWFLHGETKYMVWAWLRLNRTFRIVTIYKCLKMRKDRITVNLKFFVIVAVFIWFSLFVHTCTTLWYFIGHIEDKRRAKTSWMFNKMGVDICKTNQYICSLYFVITTFTNNGIGDILPKWQSEVIFVCFLQLISTVLLMVYVGEFSNLIQYDSFRLFSFYSKYLELKESMKNNRVSEYLMEIVDKYTLHLWKQTRGRQMPKFLETAPLSLRLRVMSAIYMHHIDKHHIFVECEPGFLRQLVGCLRLYTYNEGLYVVNEYNMTNAMYFIHTGKVRESSEEKNDDSTPRVYKAGSSFGELQGLVRNTPYDNSYQAITACQVLTLCLDDWEHLLQYFPTSKKIICKHMDDFYKDLNPSQRPGGGPSPPPSPYRLGSENNIIRSENSIKERSGSHLRDSIDPKTQINASTSVDFSSAIVSFDENDSLRSSKNVLGPIRRRFIQSKNVQLSHSLTSTDPESARGTNFYDDGKNKNVQRGFVDKITQTARKIMQKMSYSDTRWIFAENRDELLLEEDDEASIALLQQFDEARRHVGPFYSSRRKSHNSNDKIIDLSDVEETDKEMNIASDSEEGKSLSRRDTMSKAHDFKPFLIKTSISSEKAKLELNSVSIIPDVATAKISEGATFSRTLDYPLNETREVEDEQNAEMFLPVDVDNSRQSQTYDTKMTLTASEISTIEKIRAATDNANLRPTDILSTTEVTKNITDKTASPKNLSMANSTKNILTVDISDSESIEEIRIDTTDPNPPLTENTDDVKNPTEPTNISVEIKSRPTSSTKTTEKLPSPTTRIADAQMKELSQLPKNEPTVETIADIHENTPIDKDITVSEILIKVENLEEEPPSASKDDTREAYYTPILQQVSLQPSAVNLNEGETQTQSPVVGSRSKISIAKQKSSPTSKPSTVSIKKSDKNIATERARMAINKETLMHVIYQDNKGEGTSEKSEHSAEENRNKKKNSRDKKRSQADSDKVEERDDAEAGPSTR